MEDINPEDFYAALFSFLGGAMHVSRPFKKSILANSDITSFKKRDLILEKGDVCKYCYFIIKGFVRGHFDHNGEEVTSWFMMEGDIVISVISWYTQMPDIEALEALEDTVCVRLSYDALQLIYKKHREFERTVRLLTEKYYVMGTERERWKAFKADEKYKEFMRLYPHIIARASLTHIASFFCITKHTLSRIRSAL